MLVTPQVYLFLAEVLTKTYITSNYDLHKAVYECGTDVGAGW